MRKEVKEVWIRYPDEERCINEGQRICETIEAHPGEYSVCIYASKENAVCYLTQRTPELRFDKQYIAELVAIAGIENVCVVEKTVDTLADEKKEFLQWLEDKAEFMEFAQKEGYDLNQSIELLKLWSVEAQKGRITRVDL